MLAEIVVGGLEEVTMVAVSLGDSRSREVCYELSSHDVGDWTEKKRGVGASTAALKHPEESKSSRASGTNERDHRQHLAKSDYTAVSDYSGYGRTEPDS